MSKKLAPQKSKPLGKMQFGPPIQEQTRAASVVTPCVQEALITNEIQVNVYKCVCQLKHVWDKDWAGEDIWKARCRQIFLIFRLAHWYVSQMEKIPTLNFVSRKSKNLGKVGSGNCRSCFHTVSSHYLKVFRYFFIMFFMHASIALLLLNTQYLHFFKG